MVQGTGRCCIALLPAIVATLAIGASILSTVWCEAIKFSPDLSNTPDFLNLSEQTGDVLSNEDGFAQLQFGLYYYKQVQADSQIDSAGDAYVRVTDSCVYYPDSVSFDAAWKTARAFALIAPIAGGILAVGLYLSPCCIFFNRATWNSIAFLFLLAVPAFQSLTLLFLTSDACKDNPVVENRLDQAVQILDTTTTTTTDAPVTSGNMTDTGVAVSAAEDTSGYIGSETEDALRSIYPTECSWDWGMYVNIVSMIMFFVTGVIMLLMGAPTRPPPKEPEIQTVTYEQKTDETGNVVVQGVDVQTETYDPTTGGPSGGPSWADPSHQAQPY